MVTLPGETPDGFTFFLGMHKPRLVKRLTVPTFLSWRTLKDVFHRNPRFKCRWALDSGGFTELSMYGKWTITPQSYATYAEIWQPEWAAVQDWMCEPFILRKTGKTVTEHQKRTIESYHTLRSISPTIHWVPVLQGFHKEEYLRHIDMYSESGVDLPSLPLVGIGSICRREATKEAEGIIQEIHSLGIPLHAFGMKKSGLESCWSYLRSADSMAWSYGARYRPRMKGCEHQGKCNNCLRYALLWRGELLDGLTGRNRRGLFDPI